MTIAGRYQAGDKTLFFIVLVLSIPIFLLNLGITPFIEDESIRSLVALEMDLSGNLVTPTLNGELYFKKPPLWNWILLGVFKWTGSVSEFTARIPTVFFLYVFCLTIFFSYRKYLGEREAIINALVFLTCGRILFWDSLLALIDICFSWVVFLMMMWIYEQHSKRAFLSLYVGAYLLATMAFFLKALPALVFLGFTLLAIQIKDGTWRKLFSWQHFCGILSMVLLFGIYLVLYNQYYPIENLIAVFVDESTQRTMIAYGFFDTITQLFNFPAETLYHFLPWSLLGLMLFAKGMRGEIEKNDFVTYCAVIFAANIWIYWTSPEMYPRYLFMLAPFYFGIGIYLYRRMPNSQMRRVVDISFLILAGVVLIGSAGTLFAEPTQGIEGLGWKWMLAALGMSVFLILMFKQPNLRIPLFVCFLIVARMGFAMIILPTRAEDNIPSQTRTDALRIGEQFRNDELYIYGVDSMRYDVSFYISLCRDEILRSHDELVPGSYYLVNPRKYPILLEDYEPIDSVRIARREKYMYLIRPSR